MSCYTLEIHSQENTYNNRKISGNRLEYGDSSEGVIPGCNGKHRCLSIWSCKARCLWQVLACISPYHRRHGCLRIMDPSPCETCNHPTSFASRKPGCPQILQKIEPDGWSRQAKLQPLVVRPATAWRANSRPSATPILAPDLRG